MIERYGDVFWVPAHVDLTFLHDGGRQELEWKVTGGSLEGDHTGALQDGTSQVSAQSPALGH